jgi:chromosome partitioning protein
VRTILLTMYDGRTKLADQVADEVRNHFGDLVLPAVIPRNVRVSEAPGYGQSVLTYDPGSRGSTSYVEAARQIAERGVDLPPLDSTRGSGPGGAPPVGALAVPEGSPIGIGAGAPDPGRTQDNA